MFQVARGVAVPAQWFRQFVEAVLASGPVPEQPAHGLERVSNFRSSHLNRFRAGADRLLTVSRCGRRPGNRAALP